VIDGRSGPIGNDADREIFHGLRTQADAVLVGAGTVRTERYGRMVRKEERHQARVEDGLAPDPLAVIVSARLNLPEDLPLLQDEDSEVLVFTHSDDELPPSPATVHYLRAPRGAATLELRPLLRHLREERGIRSVLCEGGPALNDGLVHEGLVDELFLSLAPKLAGGEPMTMLFGPTLDPIPALELVWVLESESHLFLRCRWRH
jgi:riboflavin-specific deaminase-like protein